MRWIVGALLDLGIVSSKETTCPGARQNAQNNSKKIFLFVHFANCFSSKICYNNKCQEDRGVEETSYGLSVFPDKATKKNKKIAENLLTNPTAYGIMSM